MLFDVDAPLRQRAREAASAVLFLWEAPDAVVRYLSSGDEQLRVEARNACDLPRWDRGAAFEAARSAAWWATDPKAAHAAPRAVSNAAMAVGWAEWKRGWSAVEAARDEFLARRAA